MKKIKCPCCGYYTIDNDYDDEVIVEICPVCFWQYDLIAQEKPDKIIGPNHVSLNIARYNFKKYGVSDLDFKNKVRKPYKEELIE